MVSHVSDQDPGLSGLSLRWGMALRGCPEGFPPAISAERGRGQRLALPPEPHREQPQRPPILTDTANAAIPRIPVLLSRFQRGGQRMLTVIPSRLDF
jgi:hypothetical protein